MFLNFDNKWVKVIGDPHLGKKFVHGVPLERRGYREKHQNETFLKEMNDITAPDGSDAVAVVVIGDLFDQFQIGNEVLVETYGMVDLSAKSHPLTDYIILMGNHDVSRNVGLVSSFDVLQRMVKTENVYFITEITSLHLKDIKGPFLFCPYDAFKSTGELFSQRFNDDRFVAVFGHWDTKAFTSDHNVLPYEALSKVTDLVVSGHEHNPKEFMYDQTKIIITGSMLPYSFSEDENETIYVTRTLNEYLSNPQAFSDKCLRLILNPGEEVPENIDALQVSYKYEVIENNTKVEVVMEDFSMQSIFDAVFTENQVSAENRAKYWNKLRERDSDVTST